MFDDDDFIILFIYIGDMLIIGKNTDRIVHLMEELSKSFSMKKLGTTSWILN